MKAVLGIDPAGRYVPALQLTGRLKLPLQQLVLAGSLESAQPIAVTTGPDLVVADSSEERRILEAVLESAQRAASDLGISAETEVLYGPAATALIDCGERIGADLLIVQSERKSPFRAFFFGSVSRGLTIGAPQSVLFSKGHGASAGPVQAVFATDHSAYALKAARRFLQMGAKGIESVHIVSAVCMQDYTFWAMHFDPGRSTEERETSLRREFEQRNEALAGEFRAAGYAVTHEAPVASANEAIVHAMEEKRAELLIINAQGHGFVERMLIGSVSMHQVMIEPHSVLLIRLPHA
jgi:nucleotide-binding universal stress UspA family protein